MLKINRHTIVQGTNMVGCHAIALTLATGWRFTHMPGWQHGAY